ncbi:MAG: hypothetical protein RCG15_02135 [Candidatus Rickettsia vulgarisii]
MSEIHSSIKFINEYAENEAALAGQDSSVAQLIASKISLLKK